MTPFEIVIKTKLWGFIYSDSMIIFLGVFGIGSLVPALVGGISLLCGQPMSKNSDIGFILFSEVAMVLLLTLWVPHAIKKLDKIIFG